MSKNVQEVFLKKFVRFSFLRSLISEELLVVVDPIMGDEGKRSFEELRSSK